MRLRSLFRIGFGPVLRNRWRLPLWQQRLCTRATPILISTTGCRLLWNGESKSMRSPRTLRHDYGLAERSTQFHAEVKSLRIRGFAQHGSNARMYLLASVLQIASYPLGLQARERTWRAPNAVRGATSDHTKRCSAQRYVVAARRTAALAEPMDADLEAILAGVRQRRRLRGKAAVSLEDILKEQWSKRALCRSTARLDNERGVLLRAGLGRPPADPARGRRRRRRC